MSTSPTPGELAYTAYCGALSPRWLPKDPLHPWSALPADTQAAWEAAAQAVLALASGRHIAIVQAIYTRERTSQEDTP